MLLKDRTAIVYGGSGAVGGAVAKAFAREGAHVFIAARRIDGLEAVAGEIRAAGGKVDVAPVNARIDLDAHKVVAEVIGHTLDVNGFAAATNASAFSPLLRSWACPQ